MKNLICKVSVVIILAIILIMPMSVSAATTAGIIPTSHFYFLDTFFEKINLFFTFSPEKKAQKAIGYAGERLAETEDLAEKNKPDLIMETMSGYESSIQLAEKNIKDIKDEQKTGELLTSLSENTSKHQETLANVYDKVPDEAKEAIGKAIEISLKIQGEVFKQIAELKTENKELKQKIEELTKKVEDIQTMPNSAVTTSTKSLYVSPHSAPLKITAPEPNQQNTTAIEENSSNQPLGNTTNGVVQKLQEQNEILQRSLDLQRQIANQLPKDPCSGVSCSNCQYCDVGICKNYCQGTDTNCGCQTPINCNSQDGCFEAASRDYYCSGNSCGYLERDCSNCSCSCGGYNVEENLLNGNCSDGKDNDCDGKTDSTETSCIPLKPAYTEKDIFPDNSTSRWPIILTGLPTSCLYQRSGAYFVQGEVFYEGELVLSKLGNEIPFSYADDTFGIHARSFVVTERSLGKSCSFQFIFKESGREDTVINRITNY